MRRGEIWWATLPRPIASEPGYRHPMLILQSDEFNSSHIRTVIAAVITSNTALAAAPGNVLLSKRESGLTRPSVVNVSQLVTVDKSCLAAQVRTLSPTVLARVDDGLKLVLALR